MRELVADRFVAFERAWIDLASGAAVRLLFGQAGRVSEQILWNDQCAERARMRHPLLNVLLDYGLAANGRTFEAYGIGDPVTLSGRGASALLQHAGRFLAARGLPVTSLVARVALREVANGRLRFPSGRPLGLILQPRSILESLKEALEVAVPGGTTTIEITGGRGSGLRTARLLAARTARLAGFVPVASAVLIRLPWLRERLAGRHICILLDDHGLDERLTLAMFLSQLGTASARRHVLLRFTRAEAAHRGARPIDAMGITAMTSMVFVDGDRGPEHEELFEAARGAAGRPGLFLERLRATGYGESGSRLVVVHESSPAYVFHPRGAERPSRGVNRVLLDSPERGARLAARGRHASAVRLLTRASRVLEARGELRRAAACAEQLAWTLRDRGQSELALSAFERARTLAAQAGEAAGGDGAPGVAAAVGIGVVWTDQERFQEAEASLRGARAAADLVRDGDLSGRAGLALVRCLYWQTRYEEAAVEALALVASSRHDGITVEAWALLARVRAAMGDVRAALAAAAEATNRVGGVAPRLAATACRSMALAQRLVGDEEQVRAWSDRALRLAASGHLPLLGLRARCLLVSSLRQTCRSHATDKRAARWFGHLRTALVRRPLPARLRRELEIVCARAAEIGPGISSTTPDGALLEIEGLLEMAHTAAGDAEAINAVCQHVCERLRAACVQVVSGPGEQRTLARAGKPWLGDLRIVTRVLAAGSNVGVRVSALDEPRQAAEPIRYGRETLAVLCCRWTLGTVIEEDRAAAVLRAAALAVSPSVRGLLDRQAVVPPEPGPGELLGASEPAAALRAAVLRAARAPFPVLIEGESGSGKELVARGVHRSGPRRDRRLCTVNCAALADDLLEAELFGHARGAFTGAVGERAGLFEEADGGTIFLDEVGELSPRAQAKLLRVLQDGEVRRVGENMPRRVDARIIAATNRRLDEEVAASRFRADLRFRLDVVRITVPPLRERASDIPALALHFWSESAARVGTSATVAAETLSALSRYDWPGNIRELQNVMASLAVHAPRRGRIAPAVLPAHIARAAATSATTFEAARHEFERRFVRAALAHAGGQRARAARTLGLSRQGLAKMMRRLRIEETAG